MALGAIVSEHSVLKRHEARMDDASDKTERAALGIKFAMMVVDGDVEREAAKLLRRSRFDRRRFSPFLRRQQHHKN